MYSRLCYGPGSFAQNRPIPFKKFKTPLLIVTGTFVSNRQCLT